MKKIKFCSILLAVVLLLQGIFAFPAAADISEESAFSYSFSKVENSDAPGDILVTLYCRTNPEARITTLGATFVINTEYIDIVKKNGEVTTNAYKQEMVTLGKNSTVAAGDVPFTSFRGLSIASYNASSKLLYIFLCGMAMEGLQIKENSKIATLYLKSKTDGKLPAGAIRLLKQSEIGKECPSKAVFVTEISSKEEVGKTPSSITISVDEKLMEKAKEPETEAQNPTEKPTDKPTEEATKNTDETTAKSPADEQEGTQEKTTTPAAQEPATKKVQDMSEAEIETEIQQKAAQSKSLKLTDAQKASDAYKAYQKAVEEAEKVANDDTASVKQKREALQKVRDTQKALEKQFPALAEQLQTNGAAYQNKAGGGVWLYIGIGAAVVALAVIIVLIIKKKKKNVISNP